MARGDLDAMCYACICTLASVADSMKARVEDYITANPTYLDQCLVRCPLIFHFSLIFQRFSNGLSLSFH